MPGVLGLSNMNGYGDQGRYGGYNDFRGTYGGMKDHEYDGRTNNGYHHDMDSSFDGRPDMRDTRDPIFEVDHLATYTSKSGPMSVEDGLRKLKQMENTTGIWTMRCELIVESKDIVIIDKGNGEEQERFPLHTVQEPTAVVDDKNHEVYSSLVLFTVVEDTRKRYSNSDMHIFQSTDRKLAPQIVDEILAAKNGKRKPGYSRPMNLPPPPREQPPNPPYNYGMSQRPDMRQSMNPRASFLPDMDAGDNEALEKDVQLLNCCFDDIEKFVSRLQAAAEAYKELERRKRERSAKKNRNYGDGLLNMKARPPPGEDFVDIFQKFKFAFNLLAKLKAHIHDPNAPELVHFLFTPLSLIYEASRDPVHGGIDLADRARAPTLTSEAKQLLLNCLTSKELELWQQLGRNWTTGRDDFNGPAEVYNPRFYNGWTPAPVNIENRNKLEHAALNMNHQIEERTRLYDSRREVDDMIMPYPRHDDRGFGRLDQSRHMDPPRPIEEDIYSRSTKAPTVPPPGAITNTGVAKFQDYVEKHIDRNTRAPKPLSREEENKAYERKLREQNAQICSILHEREGRNSKEITVKKGDIVEVLDNSRNWWKVKNHKGDSGYAPYTIMQDITDGGSRYNKH